MKLYRNYNPIIPLHVFMTWKHKSLPPFMQANLNLLRSQNPEFTFHVYSDEDCIQFLTRHFPSDVTDAFHTLIPGAYKADLWRLCILYIYGGIYMDIKLSPIKKFKLIELTESEHYVLDRPNKTLHIYNALMVCKAKNQFLHQCIRQIVHNVNTQYYGESVLSPTGPEMLGRVATIHGYKLPIDLEYPIYYPDHIKYKGGLILKNYSQYRQEQSQVGTADQPHYCVAWVNRTVYNKIPV